MSGPAPDDGVEARAGIERALRPLAPRALAALVRGGADFADAEDAVQEALVAAADRWPVDGVPGNPLGWLVRVASRRRTDHYRRDEARRRRESVAGAEWTTAPAPVSGVEDSMILIFLCCHPTLTPAAAIALTLRAVGGLTTREIATAFMVPDATMAQRISRAKATVRASGQPFALPSADTRTERLRSVLHVLYLLFNEGYTSSAGPDLARLDLSAEAIRLARQAHAALPADPEVAGLLALMLLTDARRPARAAPDGELIPLAEQDRSRWDRGLISEGVALITTALRQGRPGEYQVQAAIAAVHDQAARAEETNWSEILALYGWLEQMTANPMVTLNRAVAAAMVLGPDRGLEVLQGLDARLGDHHRLHAVRAHLLEMAGATDRAVTEFRAAAAGATNVREQHYLTTQAARLATAARSR